MANIQEMPILNHFNDYHREATFGRNEKMTNYDIKLAKFDEMWQEEKSFTNFEENLTMTMNQRVNLYKVILKKSIILTHNFLERLPIKLTLNNIGIIAVVLSILLPCMITYILIYPIFRLVFGTLYPAYASYKTIRTKNVKEYVKWMMYWIVFALFTAVETFTDVFFSFWFPFYYEIKIVMVLWMLSPATKGSSILYRRFVHPALLRREGEIDEALARATEQGYTAVLQLGTKGVNYATTVLMQTAIKGGGGLVQQLKKSYSLSDLTGEKEDENRNMSNSLDETDMEVEPRRRERIGRRGYSPRRTQSSSNRVEMYFSEVDVEVRQPNPREPTASLTNIRSSDDISSGYSSGEALHTQRIITQGETLVRTASVGARTRAKQPRTATKKIPEEEELCPNYFTVLSDNNASFASPLTFLSAEEALKILSFLSQCETPNDFIKLEHTNSVSDTTENKSKSSSMESLYSMSDSQDSSTLKADDNQTTINENIKDYSQETKTIEDNQPKIDVKEITDEICPKKFEELKVLLDNANKAVSNIVSLQDNDNNSNNEIGLGSTENLSCSLEMLARAGKYNKKPAPKVPASKSEVDESQKTVKATLLIKSGTLTTITKISDEKKQPAKSHTKEGFSKLLTIPKNIFHNTFHKDLELEGEQRSRSASFGSQKMEKEVENVDGVDNCSENEMEKSPKNESINANQNEKQESGRPKLRLRQLSQSPGRSSRRVFCDID